MSESAARSLGCIRHGFTLLEILVVVAIIGLLVAILMPSLAKAREQAREAKCLSNLRTLAQAMIMYADDHQGRLPNANPPWTVGDPVAALEVLSSLAKNYVKSPEPFHCPSDTDPVPQKIESADYLKPDSARVSYDFYSVWWLPEYGPKLTRIKYAPLAWDLEGGMPVPHPFQNHGNKGGNVAHADGHAEWHPQHKWERSNWPSPAGRFYRPNH
jgi:prepilin-type N-terminal cleavage/methylation domain-containing protein/prepilin-type processing-associated H-X9-DG protein